MKHRRTQTHAPLGHGQRRSATATDAGAPPEDGQGGSARSARMRGRGLHRCKART